MSSDEAALKACAAAAGPAHESLGGRLLTRSVNQVEPREAGLPQRAVLVEFESYENALAAYESPAYRKAIEALDSGAERDFRIVEGA